MRQRSVSHGEVTADDALLDDTFADLVRDTGASVGMAYVLPTDERLLWLTLLAGASRQLAAPWARVSPDARMPVADAIRERRLVWLGSQEEVARCYPGVGLVLPYDFTLAAAPITAGDVVWGGVVLLWPISRSPELSAAERDTITAHCRTAANLLQEAADSHRPLRPAAEPRLLPPPEPPKCTTTEAVAALRFAERLPVGCLALDIDGRLTFINSSAAEMVGADQASLLGRRPWEVLTWLRDPEFEDRYRAAVVARRPTSFTARRPHDAALLFRLYPDDSGISVQVTPADAEARTSAAGTRAAGPPAPRKAPATASSELVGATALYHLTHFATTLAEAAGMRELVDRVGDQIVPAFGPQALALLTVEEGRLFVSGSRGFSEETTARFDAVPLTANTPAVHAFGTGFPSFFANFSDLQRVYPAAVRHDEMASWAFLPLVVSGQPIGALVLAYDLPHAFPPTERAILTSLAGLIAQALDRARLYDTKHDLARSLQHGLLPHDLPRVSGLDVAARYRPARKGVEIGGDFYDLIRCAPTCAIAVIGDIQGHNTNAAALMGQVRTAVHAHATAGTAPGEILTRANRLLIELDSELFASCLVARLDLAEHTASLASAGHPPPLLRHPDLRTEILRVPPGLLLGIESDARYPTSDTELEPDAVLALYTDGLVETPGTDIDTGTAALADQLAHTGPEGIEAIADDLIGHAERTAPRTDDMALLLIRP